MYEFMHRFPVDITIPSSRIASLDDIEVTIQTFDYAIPERNSLKLQADLIISGIYSETYEEFTENEDELDWNEGITIADEKRDEEAEDEAVEVEIPDVISRLDEIVEKAEDLADELEKEMDASVNVIERADAEDLKIVNQSPEVEAVEAKVQNKEAHEKTTVSEVYGESPIENIVAVPPIPDFQPAFRKSEKKEEELYEPFIVEAKRTPEKEEQEESKPFFVNRKQDEPEFDIPVPKDQVEEEVQPIDRAEEPVLAKEEENQQQVEPVMAENKESITKEREEVNLLQIVQKSRRAAAPVESQKQDAKQTEQPETKLKTSESLSIADFFSRKQEEEHVRVKVCIVQKGETLDDLAERYSISVQTLLQSNELQPNQDIYEGQVLYIRQSHTYKN